MNAYDELVRHLEADSRNLAEGEFTPDAYHLQLYADEVKRIGAQYEAELARLRDALAQRTEDAA